MQVQNIWTKYNESFQFLETRKRRQVNQLRLLNNLQRGDQNIASTLLLTLFNRVVSNMYDDKIQVKFLPSQGIQQEQINAYNILSQSDYLEMGKAKLDYDWTWDTLFFGRGYMETLRFDKKRKIMAPSVINPLVFGYDPYFEEVQQWRYYWKWVSKSKWELQKLIKNGTITGVSKVEEIPSGIETYLWDYKVKRDDAKKATQPPIDPADKDVYQILEFYGYDEDGDKAVYWVDRSFSTILMVQKLDLEDEEAPTDVLGNQTKEKKAGSKWPIVVKEAFREPHSTVNFSVADLLEDKHRAKSVLLNLAFIAAKDRANPIYGYNPDKVRDISQFFSRQIDQHIPMDDESAVWPLNTQDPMSSGLINFITMLQQEATDPIGVGVSVNPETGTSNNTATEAAIDQQLNDIAQSILSKVMQFGEAEFWSHWFHRYQKYGPELKEKMANIVGVKGVNSEVVDLQMFQTKFPPGIMVYSAKEAEYKELVLRRDLMQMFPNFAQTLDADGMRNFQKFVFLPKFLQDPSLIDIMLPKTIDEIDAEAENEELKNDKMPDVKETDNHTTHLYTHMQVQPKTWSTWMHIEWHKELLAKQKAMEQQQMEMQTQQMSQQMNQPKVGVERGNPRQQASPLKTEIKNQPQVK